MNLLLRQGPGSIGVPYNGEMLPRLALMAMACAWPLLVSCGSPSRAISADAAAPTSVKETTGYVSLGNSPHVRFGVPVDGDSSDDYLMDKGAYVLSYNRARGSPFTAKTWRTGQQFGMEEQPTSPIRLGA